MDERFIDRREVERLTGLSRSTIYERMRAGTFPKARREPGWSSVWWLESEIREWMDARIARSVVVGSVVGTPDEAKKKAA